MTDRPRDRIRWWAMCEISSAMLILQTYPNAPDTAKRMQAAEDTLDLLDYLELEEHKKLYGGYEGYHKAKRDAKAAPNDLTKPKYRGSNANGPGVDPEPF